MARYVSGSTPQARPWPHPMRTLLSAVPCQLLCLLLAFGAEVQAQSLGQTQGQQARAALPNGVASGDVTATSAVLWARSRDPGVLWFQISRRSDFLGTQRAKATWIGDPLLPGKVQFNRLRPDTQYFYRAIVFARPFQNRPGTPMLLSYEGRFRTPALPGRRTGHAVRGQPVMRHVLR